MQKVQLSRPNALTAMLFGASMLALASGPMLGCSGAEDDLREGASGTSSTGTDTGTETPTGPDSAEQLFRKIEPTLMTNCGNSACHGDASDNPFLNSMDPYASVIAWPGVVVKDYNQSKLLVRPRQGSGHAGGVNIDDEGLVDTLKPGLEAWLEAEAKTIQGGDDLGPQLEPIVPIMGFNALYLDALGPEFEGFAITFNADELTDNLLVLTDLQVHTTSTDGLHIVHPLFVVYPRSQEADPDPGDNFFGFEDFIDIGTVEPLGPGTLVLSNWKKDARLSVAFESIAKYLPDEGGGNDGACVEQALFDANARNQFQQSCGGCHGGGMADATAAVDMRDLQNDPVQACAQIRNRIDLTTPANSQVFIVTMPGGNAAHPFKFGGNQTNYNNFRTAVSMWADQEAAAAGQQ
ncbi:MAG TPA: hypothetical protein VLS89_11985 [Candidatus Nanopelagicales bacterium]|nr:hypothetical protein [Candidatus Nanopelagicales bacterium]